MKKWIRKKLKKWTDTKEIVQESKKIVTNTPLSNIPQLKKPFLWRFDNETVARGVAAGLFGAMIPVIPFQMLVSGLVAVFIRGNLPLSLAVSWVSNPLTVIPITYFTYYLGNLILGNANADSSVMINAWHYETSVWESLKIWVIQFGKGFFVGLPFIAFGASLLGYISIRIIYFVVEHLKKKKTK